MTGRDTDASVDEDRLLSAGESLALIERQQQAAQRQLGFNPTLILGLWGAAYLFGFGAIFLTYPTAVPLRLRGAVAAVNIGVTRLGLPDDAVTLLWSGSSLLLVGVLYLAAGALFQDRFQYGLGVWMLVSGACSVYAGVPGNFAVVSLAGGGGLLLAAGYFALRHPHRPARA